MKIAIFVGAILLAFQGTTVAYELTTKDIQFIDDGEVSNLTTRATTVEQFLDINGIQLHTKDIINANLDDYIEDDKVVIIDRGFDVNVVAGNARVVPVKVSVEKTMGELRNLISERTGNYYIYNGDMSRTLEKGELVNFTQIDEELIIIEEYIGFTIETVYTDELLRGEERIIRTGEYGVRAISTLKIFENGEEVSNEVVNVKVLKEPVNTIKEVGTRTEVTTSTGNFVYVRSLTMNATAYSAQQAVLSNYTATGIPAVRGVVAVDPRVIPLGTRLYIPGYGHALAADTGRDIIGNRIDLCFDTVREAIVFGRQNIKVYILQ